MKENYNWAAFRGDDIAWPSLRKAHWKSRVELDLWNAASHLAEWIKLLVRGLVNKYMSNYKQNWLSIMYVINSKNKQFKPYWLSF